jgi:hypothetical protein
MVKKLISSGKSRDTVMVRVDRTIRDEIKKVSISINQKITRIVDSVLSKYLKTVERNNVSKTKNHEKY